MATKNNGYQGQITTSNQPGYVFRANQDLMDLIIQDSKWTSSPSTIIYIERIGIQAQPETVVLLTNRSSSSLISGQITTSIKIGKTGLYEANDVQINHIAFQNDTQNVIIDYIINYEEVG